MVDTYESSENSDDDDFMDSKANDLFNQLMKTVDADHGSRERDKIDKHDESYKNKAYWNLPENVRNAIDLAKMKSKHSEFYYRL